MYMYIQANAFFDGVLPPFSNIGNTGRGTTLDSPTIRGIGRAADFSTANPTSAYDTVGFGKAEIYNKDILVNPITGKGPEDAAKATLRRSKGDDSYAARSLANFGRWRAGEQTDDKRRFDTQTPEGKKK